MEIVCIDVHTWELLKRQISRLTSDASALKAVYCTNPRDGWMDSADVCRALGISKRTLQTWRNNEKIPYAMLGGKVYFKEKDIYSLLQTEIKPLKK